MKTVSSSGRRYGFYPFLLLLMTGVCGSFLTADVFNLYVWFEVLLISSYGLLILGNDRIQLDGAVKYGVLNLVGTNLFLIATGLLYGIFGTLNMADIAVKVDALDNPASGTLATVAALYFLAFAMKAAAFPVNFWLPASYHTPNIVVSAVFAGLLTKVGVYALIRIFVLILPESLNYMADVIGIVAIATLITGALGALAQSEIRRLLGYLVIAGIGFNAGRSCDRLKRHAGNTRDIGRDLLRGPFDHRHDGALHGRRHHGHDGRFLQSSRAWRSLPQECRFCGRVPGACIRSVRSAAVFGVLAKGHAC